VNLLNPTLSLQDGAQAYTFLPTEGDHLATSAKRVRALREVERRGFRSFTIGVSEDDLRVIAEQGYEGAASADLDQQAQAVSLFITDMLAASIGQG
jgi:hypothetical protein